MNFKIVFQIWPPDAGWMLLDITEYFCVIKNTLGTLLRRWHAFHDYFSKMKRVRLFFVMLGSTTVGRKLIMQ